MSKKSPREVDPYRPEPWHNAVAALEERLHYKGRARATAARVIEESRAKG